MCKQTGFFFPEADLWSLGPANGNKKKHGGNTRDVAFTKTDGNMKYL